MKTLEDNEPMFRHLHFFKSKTVPINIIHKINYLPFPEHYFLNWLVSHDCQKKKLALTSVDILDHFNTQSEGHVWYKSAVPRRKRKPSSLWASYLIKKKRYLLLWTKPVFGHSRIRFLSTSVCDTLLFCRVPVNRCLNGAFSKRLITGSLRHATKAHEKNLC
jgi:hypothetical protein